MKILIITFGSLGDVQPYVALGKGLQSSGHMVTICTASRFESFITDHNLAYGYMTDGFLRILDTDMGRDVIEHSSGMLGIIRSIFKLIKYIKPLAREMIIDSWEVAKTADPDLIIYHPKILGAVSIAEKFGIPVIMANLQPMIVPTNEFPMAGMPTWNIGRWYNKATYSLIKLGLGMYKNTVNDFRESKLNLPPFPKTSGMLLTADGKPISIIHGYSSHIIPRPSDWPEQATVNGYWFLDQLDDWQPSSELKDFLDAGEAPVYIGFGSMAGRNPRRLADIAIEALARTKLRGIIATGWGGLETYNLPESIMKIDHAPHDWLFPRMSAIVHHGGAGTTSAVLRAGKPMTICPFIADQPFWGECIYGLGVGPKPIPHKKLTVEKLVSALHEMTHNATMRKRAKMIGQLIQDENGIKDTVGVIEDVLQRHRHNAAYNK
jgi:sterol 3beta-glucosyltransferase